LSFVRRCDELTIRKCNLKRLVRYNFVEDVGSSRPEEYVGYATAAEIPCLLRMGVWVKATGERVVEIGKELEYPEGNKRRM